MWLRYCEWGTISDQQQVKVVEFGFRRYLFWKKDEGVADVRNRDDADRILRMTDFELAYDKYGIFWNPAGTQIDPVETNGTHASAESVTMPVPETVTVSSVSSETPPLPPKLTMAERMAKMRAARKFKKLGKVA